MDRQTFDRLILASLPAAQRFAIRLSGDPAAAEDLVHDALVRAARRWASFRGQSSFQTWFFQIVINVWRDRLRRGGREENLPDLPQRDPRSSDPSQRLIGDELGQLVAEHVSSLPPRQREVLVLVAYEGFSPSEAASVLGISDQNARVNLHHARQRLKQLLAGYLNDERTERESTGRSIPTE